VQINEARPPISPGEVAPDFQLAAVDLLTTEARAPFYLPSLSDCGAPFAGGLSPRCLWSRTS